MNKLIYPEKQGTATATSANAAYPVTNLTANDVRKECWKAAAAVENATLRCPISANADGLTVQGTNAESAICTVTLDSAEKIMDASPAVDAGGGLVKLQIPLHGMSTGNVVLVNGTTNYDGVSTLPSQALGDANNLIITATFVAETPAITDTACVVVETETHDLATISVDRFWQAYTSQAAAHTATIELTAASGATVHAGIFRAGTLVEISGPQYGAGEGEENYDIIYSMRNGAFDGKSGEEVRTFDYQITILRETTLRTLQRIAKFYRPDPFAMLISDQAGNDNMWSVYGRLLSWRVTHTTSTESTVSISIEEVV